ncbi:MAG: hypothetical protein ABJC07_07345 [Acidobacteriota bacterium]
MRLPELTPFFTKRMPGEFLSGQSSVAISISRAVLCGNDHVYDAHQFNVCPNCAAQERLQLSDLLMKRVAFVGAESPGAGDTGLQGIASPAS